MPKITVYTDGGTRNTGNFKGGKVKSTDLAAWAYLIIYDDKKFYASKGVLGATNNQMELTGLLKALQKLKSSHGNHFPITLYSDSKYIIDAINQHWLDSWAKKNWRKSNGKLVLNQGLWKEIYSLLKDFSQISFIWVKGHSNNVGNNFVDWALNRTMDKMKAISLK